MEWWEEIKKAYGEQGYLVLGWPGVPPEKAIGEVITWMSDTYRTLNLPQPFRIISESNAEEYQQQQVLIGHPRVSAAELAEVEFYYRAVTD